MVFGCAAKGKSAVPNGAVRNRRDGVPDEECAQKGAAGAWSANLWRSTCRRSFRSPSRGFVNHYCGRKPAFALPAEKKR